MYIKRSSILALFASAAVAAEKRGLRQVANNAKKNNEFMEDIEFWTRMTQAMSLPTTKRPTSRPTPSSNNKPTPKPVPSTPAPVETAIPSFIDTPLPTVIIVDPTDEPTVVIVDPTDEPTLIIVDPTDEPTSIDPFPTAVPTPVASLLCGLTEDERAAAFTELALSVTPQSILDDPFSSQSLALQWIIEDDVPETPVCPNVDDCKALERYVMASFYFATGGGKWDQCNAPATFTPDAIETANAACERVVTPFPVNNPRIGTDSSDAWLTPSDTCEWGGLACWGTDDSRSGCMDQLDFENDGLAGTLIPEMSSLEDLRFFILEQGNTTGTIPSEYGLFDRLLIFDMDFNDLTGEIPEELFDLNQLQQLDLNDNQLQGPLSTNIGQLTTLTFIQLDHNFLSGTIPTEMGELDALRKCMIWGAACPIFVMAN